MGSEVLWLIVFGFGVVAFFLLPSLQRMLVKHQQAVDKNIRTILIDYERFSRVMKKYDRHQTRIDEEYEQIEDVSEAAEDEYDRRIDTLDSRRDKARRIFMGED